MATVKEMMMQDAAASIETSYMMAVGDTFEGTITNIDRRHGGLGRGRTGSGDDLSNRPFRPWYGYG